VHHPDIVTNGIPVVFADHCTKRTSFSCSVLVANFFSFQKTKLAAITSTVLFSDFQPISGSFCGSIHFTF